MLTSRFFRRPDDMTTWAAHAPVRRRFWGNLWSRLRHDYLTLFCIGVIISIILVALLAPLIAPMDPNQSSIANRLRPIGFKQYLLGTDEQGRDMLSRLIWGGRISLLSGILPVFLATLIGGFLGVVAGYFGRGTNMVIMRTMDVFFAFPSVLLAVAIAGSLGGGIVNQLITLTLVFIPPLCRVAETATIQIRNLDFVAAARVTGASSGSIIFHHVLINILPPLLIYASTMVSLSIIIASGLSFLGLGVSPPTADWGLMLSSLRQAIYVQPLVAALPGLAIFITSVAFNLVSEGLRRALDVRT